MLDLYKVVPRKLGMDSLPVFLELEFPGNFVEYYTKII
jgi:hypothetical protein